MEREKELEEGLIGLMYALGISKVRMMLSLALIRSHQIHLPMAKWVLSYRGKENTLTAQTFMSKFNELTDDIDSY
jgi:hypothetical protein